uniref:Conserved plasma membrane protein n=1 Tax=Heterorhabditis bacteriophora TaxID=37862 RepID=A0A1I7XFT0_HETBA
MLQSLFIPLIAISLPPILFCRSTSRHDVTFVHTFDTREMCMSRCRTMCTQHHSEDLMMPRWHCPVQEDDSAVIEDDSDSGIVNNLFIIVPGIVFGGLLFLFICVSCMQRFFKNDM